MNIRYCWEQYFVLFKSQFLSVRSGTSHEPILDLGVENQDTA